MYIERAVFESPSFFMDVIMKKFRIQIRAYGYYVDFTVDSEDDRDAIEKAILDKVGQKELNWEKDGFSDSSRRKWITYEEVNNDSKPIHYEEVLGTRVATGTPEAGQI
jgi:hypothetical protein|tara:strand:- start:109 stop:432 length:324 start_codon:yes stop_codon:yes gene_type:complete